MRYEPATTEPIMEAAFDVEVSVIREADPEKKERV